MSFVSGEWMLTSKKRRANGGSVVLGRALWSSGIAYALILALRELLDPTKTFSFSLSVLRTLLLDTMAWFGAIFAAAFTSLYARFASQWIYLANLYNQIKAAEVRAAGNEEAKPLLAQWKAGFIEDAAELHLATKPLFASVITSWVSDALIREEFGKHGGGKARFDSIVAAARVSYNERHGDLPKQPLLEIRANQAGDPE